MRKQPFRVTLLLALVLILTAWNALRAWTAFAWQPILSEFGSRPGPGTVILISLSWLILGLLLFWSIQKGKAWAPHFLLGTTAGYSVWYWIERLVWQNPHPNWQFAVIVNLALILFILFSKKSLVREAYERKIENPKTK
ncbi:MAG: hypothetical protein K8S20_15670 [Chloroflexi bacterium]|nr:hypothetical protein [Chloroflexota bacterium]